MSVVKIIHKGFKHTGSSLYEQGDTTVSCLVTELPDTADALKTAAADALAAVGNTYPYTAAGDRPQYFRMYEAVWLRGNPDDDGAIAQVYLYYSDKPTNVFGLQGVTWKALPADSTTNQGSVTILYRGMASESAARAQALTDYPTHPKFSTSPPVVGQSSSVRGILNGLLDVAVTNNYEWPPLDLDAHIRSLSTPTSSSYAKVTSTNKPEVSGLSPTNFRKALAGVGGPKYPAMYRMANGVKKYFKASYSMPAVRIEIFTRSSSAPTPPIATFARGSVTANGVTYTNATFIGVTSKPVNVSSGFGVTTQFDNDWVYTWSKEYSETDPDVDGNITPTFTIP